MKLLFVLENYPPHYGGVEVVFENICTRLAKHHRVALITHRVRGSKKQERKKGVHITRTPRCWWRHAFILLAPFYSLGKKADLVHTTTFNSAAAGWLIARLKRIPVVLTVHETWIGKWALHTNMPRWKIFVHECIERCIFALHYDTYICVSDTTAAHLKAVLPAKLHDRIVVNHNGVDYTHWHRKKHAAKAKRLRKRLGVKKPFVVLGYGRPVYTKGLQFLARAFPKVLNSIRAHLVLIVSRDKAFEQPYQELVKSLDAVRSHVTLLPAVPYKDLPSYILMADCVVVPSLAEGFGYTTVETNALGVPVVASDVGSIPEVISGKHVLVTPADPTSIAEGILNVHRKEYSVKKGKKYRWKANVKRLEEVYASLTSSS
ncbi:MAG: glycosyltransferase family 4 protein [Candidatus Woesearchaeota archaeon]|nr:glycosyltransferase family 4 protein [Candidatus Woesearchaeota archaeon]